MSGERETFEASVQSEREAFAKKARTKPKPAGPRLDVNRLADVVVGGAAVLISKRLEPLIARLEIIEAKLAERERASLHFCGVHQRSADYQRGDCVTFDGALWVAIAETSATVPGSSAAWQLAVKR